VEGAAPAETAAQMELVHVALFDRQAGRLAAASSAASPFWVGHQTSQRSGVQSAVAFIGSMVAWFW
jgi:hypothetical protein